jgi:hypothetical protein
MNIIRPNTLRLSTLTPPVLESITLVVIEDITEYCRGVEDGNGGKGVGTAEIGGVGLEMGVPGVDAGVNVASGAYNEELVD